MVASSVEMSAEPGNGRAPDRDASILEAGDARAALIAQM